MFDVLSSSLLAGILGSVFFLLALSRFFTWRAGRKYKHKLERIAALTGIRDGDVSFEKIEFALRSLGWELDTLRKNRVVPLSEDIFSRLTKFFSAADASEEEFFEQTLTFLSRHFRAPGIGLVLIDGAHVRTYTHGITGPRFQSAVQQIVVSEIEQGVPGDEISITDLQGEARLRNDLSIFNIRYSLTSPFIWNAEDGQRVSGALWFGYEEAAPPTHLEKHWASEFSKRLGADFYSCKKIHALQGEVQQVQSKSDEKDDYLAHVSHDIKTPLNNIKAILQLFRLEADESHHEFLEVALTNCQSLAELVDGVLEYTRHRAGKLVASPESFSLYECASEVVELFQVSAFRKNLHLTLGGDESLQVYADRKQVKRVLTNIISNSVKYTASGSISVALFQSESGPRVAVVDTGLGMSEDQLEKLFEPFSRFAENTAEGSGLGLALTKILTDLNKGALSVTSKLHRGTRFELTLPAGEAKIEDVELIKDNSFHVRAPLPKASELTEQEQPVLQSFAEEAQPFPVARTDRAMPHKVSISEVSEEIEPKKKVLLIDDDFDLVETLSRLLTAKGYTVFTATNEQEALGICNFSVPDVVVADYDMPGGGVMTFLEDCGVLRKVPNCIVLSGIERNVTHPNIIGMILKPVEIGELTALIEGEESEPVIARPRVALR